MIDWPALEVRHGWLAALAGCPQDPRHHAEGDVLTHTRLVVEALLADPDWRALDAAGRAALVDAALLHDVAKPAVTRQEYGRVVAPGHAPRGARKAQALLYHQRPADLPIVPFDHRQAVVALVRWHGLPLWFLDRGDPERAIITASLQVPPRLLAILARADVRGRVCQDAEELLARVALFEQSARELGCWAGAYRFASGQSRFEWLRKPGRDPAYAAWEEPGRCQMTLLAGLPGAGKDSWLARADLAQHVISLDALREARGVDPRARGRQGRVAQAARELAREHLRAGRSFVWNATNLTRDMRRALVDLGTSYGARVGIVYLEAPWPELLRRNEVRERRLPASALRRLAGRFEVPGLGEARQVHYQVHDVVR